MMGVDLDESYNETQMTPERHEISQMVKSRMHSLGQPSCDYGNITIYFVFML